MILQLKSEEDKAKKMSDTDHRMMQIKKLQHEINKLLTEEMAKKIKQAKQENFEYANRSGKWLAYKLRKEKSKNLIYKLVDEDQTERTDKEGIEKTIKNIMAHYIKQQIRIRKELSNIYKGTGM